jgi:hypothetical protein
MIEERCQCFAQTQVKLHVVLDGMSLSLDLFAILHISTEAEPFVNLQQPYR